MPPGWFSGRAALIAFPVSHSVGVIGRLKQPPTRLKKKPDSIQLPGFFLVVWGGSNADARLAKRYLLRGDLVIESNRVAQRTTEIERRDL